MYLVSGGFRIIINRLAEELGVDKDRVVANTLLWDEDGKYAGFDPEEFTSRSGGKLEAVKSFKVGLLRKFKSVPLLNCIF